jgi:hypothetical protein
MFLRPSLSASGRCALLLLVVVFVVLLLAMERDLNVYDEAWSSSGPCASPMAKSLIAISMPIMDRHNFMSRRAPSILGECLWDTLVRVLTADFRFSDRREMRSATGIIFRLRCQSHLVELLRLLRLSRLSCLLFVLISVFFLLHVFQGRQHGLMLLAGGASVGRVMSAL